MLIRGFKLLWAGFFCCICLYGQASSSRLTGNISDSTGAAVVDATVTATNEGTGVAISTKSSGSGVYVFDAIPTGNYTLAVTAAGFKTYSSRTNTVTIGQPTTVNVTLEVGAVSDRVEVSGAAEIVQTSTSGNLGNVLSEQVIKDLPIVGTRGRNPLQLVLLQPGVADGSNTGGGYHIHGARDRAWNFTLDGIDNNDPTAGGSNFSPTRTNPDALSEYRVVTSNPTADLGRNSGANVVLVSKQGTNEFHGTGFWFYRTPKFNANEWSNNLNGLGKRQFVQNIYGGSIGGPIWKNKTFFFYNIQRLAATDSRTVNRLVFTQDARQGNLRFVNGGRNRPAGATGASVDPSGNPLPGLSIGTYNVAANDPQRAGLDPTIKGLVAKTPLPNNFTGGDGLNTAYYTWAAPQFERQQDHLIRLDHILNSKNALFARAAWGYQNSVCDAANAGTEFFPGSGCNVNTERSPRNLAFSWRSSLTPRLINELIVGESFYVFDFRSPQATPGAIFFQGGDGGGTVSNSLGAGDAPVLVDNLSYALGNLRELRTRQVVENLSYFKGAHALKGGFNLRFVSHKDVRGSIGGANRNVSVNFDPAVNAVDPATFGLPAGLNVAFDRPEFQRNINFLLGRVGRVTQGFASNGSQYVDDFYRVNANYKELEFYFQDTWKVRRNLTVDLGLRWEARFSPTEERGLILRPSQPLIYGAAPTNSAKWVKGSLYQDSLNNFGPSIGFAWDPFNNGKTSIRSNYRTAYDRLPTFGISGSILPNLPGITFGAANTEFGQNGGRLANLPKLSPPPGDPSASAQPAAFGTGNITVLDPDLKTATTHMWSFGIQREIMRNTVISVDYIGRRAYHLLGAYNANQVDVTRNGFISAFNTAKGGGESALLDQLTSADTRRNAGESGAAYLRRQFATELSLNSVGAVAANLAQRQVGTRGLPEASGVSPYFFLPYPQFASTNGVRVIDSNDFSTYHGLEIQFLRRMTSGLEFQFSWTWSKSLDTRSFDPSLTIFSTGSSQSASSTPFDIANRRLNYARSDFDRRHVFQSYWIYELPFGRGKRFAGGAGSMLNALVGGWNLAGFLRYQTGRPFTVFSGANTLSNVFQSTADCNGCSPSDGRVFNDPTSGLAYYFNETERNRFTTPAAGSIGNTGRNFFQIAGQFNIDTTFMKRVYFAVKDRPMNFEIRADVTNLTNTPQWDVPTAVRTSGTFGLLRTPLDVSRKIQLGAKFNF